MRGGGAWAAWQWPGDDFVEAVAEGNWPKLIRSGDIGLFGDEGEEGGAESRKDLLVAMGIFNHLPYLVFKQILVGMKEIDGKIVRTWGFSSI